MNKVNITTDKIKSSTFSFFDKKAIQEIRIELIPIKIIDMITKVWLMYDKPGILSKNAVDTDNKKNIVIVLKYMLRSCFCLVK
jgi:hypothetical protein